MIGAIVKLSVVLAVNRSNPFLRQAIESVLTQDYTDFELLIGANACPDSLVEEIHSIVGSDARARLIRTTLPQLCFTLNRLVEDAEGEWIVRMDADDVCEPHRLARLVHATTIDSPDVIGSWATLIDAQGRVIGAWCPPTSPAAIRLRFLLSSQLFHPTVAFKRCFWLRMRGYLGGYVSEDFDLWLRAINSGVRIVNLPEPLLRYRIHSNQASRSRLGYAEVASHWYRELLLKPTIYNLLGWSISTGKALLMPMRNRWRHR